MPYRMEPIGHIQSDLPEKFGIPRQSGLVPALSARLVFAPAYRDASALRGLSPGDRLWLLWVFHLNKRRPRASTVRPPRLGGNVRLGVFATRSPFRPNPIGLSCVELERIAQTERGPVLHLRGADLADGTPVLDIKPYLPYADSWPEAVPALAAAPWQTLAVDIPPALLSQVPPDLRPALEGILAQDPRPAYQKDAKRGYGLSFGGFTVRFTVSGSRLTVTGLEKLSPRGPGEKK